MYYRPPLLGSLHVDIISALPIPLRGIRRLLALAIAGFLDRLAALASFAFALLFLRLVLPDAVRHRCLPNTLPKM